MGRYAACYDIAHDGRRAQVARVLLDYGHRVQRSVFELSLDPDDLPEFRRRIGPLLARADRFDLYPIDTRRPEARLSWQRPPVPDDVIFFGPFPDGTDPAGGDSPESRPLPDESTMGYDADPADPPPRPDAF